MTELVQNPVKNRRKIVPVLCQIDDPLSGRLQRTRSAFGLRHLFSDVLKGTLVDIDLRIERQIQSVDCALDGERDIKNWIFRAIKSDVAEIEITFLLVENGTVSLHLV